MMIAIVIFTLTLLWTNAATASDPGDLIQVTITKATVGVLLDEVFPDDLSRVKNYFLSQNESFWIERVYKQLNLTNRRLLFRAHGHSLSNETSPYGQLILPPYNQLAIKFSGRAAVVMDHGHLLVARNYTLSSHIVGLAGTAATADPKLRKIGGCAVEKFTLPADPQLVFQRTGFACMNEQFFPMNSIDAEAVTSYFDDTCTAEPPAAKPHNCQQCHCMQTPNMSCVAAMEARTGTTRFDIQYCREKWNETLAKSYEAKNQFKLEPSSFGADMKGIQSNLKHNWIIYRYYAEGACELNECLKHAGWRKLLVFDATHINVGHENLHIGPIPYFEDDPNSFSQLLQHNLYYWDNCHGHPHFSAYAAFTWGNSSGHKQAFCIRTTNREINSRLVPITTPYTCRYQGLSVGWSDSYNGGLPCQWVDITDAPPNTTHMLTDTVNPKNWLCEGQEKLYANGSAMWQPTGELTKTPPYTVAKQSIDKKACRQSPNVAKNNFDQTPVNSLLAGMGYLTFPCLEAGQTFGSERDCEFQMSEQVLRTCLPGESVTLSCHGAQSAQVVRICEASHALKAGSACRTGDPFTLASAIVSSAKNSPSTTVTFTCPDARDDVEVGGLYAVYTGAQLNGLDGNEAVRCVAK